MSWWRLVYLELSYNSLPTFVIVTLAAWVIERIANFVVDNLEVPVAGGLLAQVWNPAGIVGLLIGIGATVLAVLLTRVVFQLARRFSAQTTGSGAPPSLRRGLILVYGREATARKAIAHHRATLDFIWFILTDQTEEEFKRLPAHWWGRAVGIPEKVVNPLKPDETGRTVENAIDHARVHGLAAEQLVCDITGGTTAMTVGAFAAAVRRGVMVQMVPSRTDRRRNAIEPLEPIEIAVSTESGV